MLTYDTYPALHDHCLLLSVFNGDPFPLSRMWSKSSGGNCITLRWCQRQRRRQRHASEAGVGHNAELQKRTWLRKAQNQRAYRHCRLMYYDILHGCHCSGVGRVPGIMRLRDLCFLLPSLIIVTSCMTT